MKNYWLNKRGAKKQPTMNSCCQFCKFLNESRELEARWGKTGLLDGIDSRYSRDVTAVILEGQRLVNELPSDDKECFKRTDAK